MHLQQTKRGSRETGGPQYYKLPDGDFERIDVDIDIRDDAFYLTPRAYKYADSSKKREIERIDKPLSFTREYASPFWTRQLIRLDKQKPAIISWALDEICRIVEVHIGHTKLPHIQETDILRASGPLKHLGMQLNGYVGKGYDCLTQFSFLNYPAYTIPVEIKRNSSGFKYHKRNMGEMSFRVLWYFV